MLKALKGEIQSHNLGGRDPCRKPPSTSLAGRVLDAGRTAGSYSAPLPLTFIFQPKIIWLKNKMDLQGNPKYRALSQLGICSLEIRKPSPFDGGIYTCKATNALGEASVDCRVDVKGKNGEAVPRVPVSPSSTLPERLKLRPKRPSL